MVKARTFILDKRPDGFPKETDFKLVEEELPPLKDGEYLAEAVYLSVDPYMRGRARSNPLGTVMVGGQVAKVIESKNSKHPVGQYIVGYLGWRSHTIPNAQHDVRVLPDFEGLPLSLGIGALGMPGNTAYFGFLELCQPKAGETVVVTGAAGAVGSLVGQIAKIKGCKVVGIAGSDEKGKWLIDELKFDHFVNYKDPDFEKKLDAVVPNGIDCYFDNVGGDISSIIFSKMNLFGRVSICGGISSYNDKETQRVLPVLPYVLFKQLKVEGFIVTRWNDRWLEGIEQMKKWIKEGKLKYRETITEGFEKMFEAFADMLKGGNIGKAVVKA